MSNARRLYRHSITIYTDTERVGCSIADLAQDAIDGDAICDPHTTVSVRADDPSVPEGVQSFFGVCEDAEDDESEDTEEEEAES